MFFLDVNVLVQTFRPRDTPDGPAVRDWVVRHLRGNDIPDAYLAALALESGATMVTRDHGFRRFAPLRTIDPAS